MACSLPENLIKGDIIIFTPTIRSYVVGDVYVYGGLMEDNESMILYPITKEANDYVLDTNMHREDVLFRAKSSEGVINKIQAESLNPVKYEWYINIRNNI